MLDQLLADLAEEMPQSILIDESLKTPLYAWRLTDEQQTKLFQLTSQAKPIAKPQAKPQTAPDVKTEQSVPSLPDLSFLTEALAMSLGGSEGPCFDTAKGRAFLARIPLNRKLEWGNKVLELCELHGPSESRKKKSDEPISTPSLS